MESALFYILSKKITTLSKWSTFATFPTDYDFSSERGRRVAQKNSSNLLRKCRYQVAAAFSLLADPPFLMALHTLLNFTAESSNVDGTQSNHNDALKATNDVITTSKDALTDETTSSIFDDFLCPPPRKFPAEQQIRRH
jgi:hypothetical protein